MAVSISSYLNMNPFSFYVGGKLQRDLMVSLLLTTAVYKCFSLQVWKDGLAHVVFPNV